MPIRRRWQRARKRCRQASALACRDSQFQTHLADLVNESRTRVSGLGAHPPVLPPLRAALHCLHAEEGGCSCGKLPVALCALAVLLVLLVGGMTVYAETISVTMWELPFADGFPAGVVLDVQGRIYTAAAGGVWRSIGSIRLVAPGGHGAWDRDRKTCLWSTEPSSVA